jgi:hypothetical protein
MSTNKQNHGTPFSKTATHATSAVATVPGVSNQTYYVTDISGSSDKATALILVKDGSTVIWQDSIYNTEAYSHGFIQPLPCTQGNTLTVTVDGTAICNANVAGFIVNNS